jgi:hypothetical protein
MSYKIIPLGMRCQAVQVVERYISQPRFPFDWCQININSMCDILSLQKENVEEYYRNYLSELDMTTTRHKLTNSWFPHDDITPGVDMEPVIQKYVRRTHRLLDAIHNIDTPIIFLVFFSFPNINNYRELMQLIGRVSSISSVPLHFFVVNCDKTTREESNIFYLHEDVDYNKGDEAFSDLVDRASAKFKNYMERFIPTKPN